MNKNTIRAVLALIALALGLALATFHPAARAAEPSKCGAFATGIRADGVSWTGAAPRMWVNRAGAWSLCQPWVPDGGDPEAPEPAPAVPCAARTTYETWQVGEAVCTSVPPGVSTSTTLMLQATAHGRVGVVIDEFGNERGLQVWRCVQGAWRLEGQTCDYLVKPAVEKPPKRGQAKRN